MNRSKEPNGPQQSGSAGSVDGSDDQPRDLENLLFRYAEDRRARGLPFVDPRGRSSRLHWLGWSLVSATLSAIVLAFVLGYRLDVIGPAPELAGVAKLDSQTLEGLDERGQRVWVRSLPGTISYPQVLRSENGSPTLALASVLSGEDGQMFAMEPTTGEIRWSRSTGFADANLAGPSLYTGARWVGWRDQEMVTATVIAGRWYPCGIQSIDPRDGSLLGTYYHPGHLHYGPIVDLDEDGVPSSILYGDNSSARFDPTLVPFETERHCGSIVLLDPGQFWGQAYPYSQAEGRAEWPGVEPASERAYLCVAPIDADTDANVMSVSVAPAKSEGMARIEARLTDGRIVIMNEELRPLGVYLTLDQAAELLDRENEGPLETRFVYIAHGRIEWPIVEITIT